MPDPLLLPIALRELGPSSVLQYGTYQLALRSGWLRRRTPPGAWDQSPWASRAAAESLAARPPFLFDPAANVASQLRRALHGASAVLKREAAGILDGRFALFGGPVRDLGFPPDWNRPPGDAGTAAGAALRSDRHWSAYDLDGELDWRSLWELSRFGWAYTLGRAYRLTGEARYWEGCWALLVSWRAANPPNTGPQWVSAQEAGLRIMALAFAWYAFAPQLDSQPDRAAALLDMVAVHAARIPPTLAYARAQRNNHLLSEAVGLYTAGTLFPALPEAPHWSELGRRWLVSALADQVFPDGGYIQHSVNYHRLALGLGLWTHGLAQAQGAPLPEASTDALRRLTGALAALVEPDSGAAPHFGHDDGSQALPLSTCDHQDLRPLLQAAGRALFGHSSYPPGPWDEASFWLGLLPAGRASEQPSAALPASLDYPEAGLHLLRGGETWAVLRCCRYRSRPAHSDQLHLDLWRKGANLALDPGSYRYTGPVPGDNALGRAAVHNGPMAAGTEPMRRAGRFLWLAWAQGRVLGRLRSDQGDLEAVAVEHDGYRRAGWTCRRTVVRAGDRLWLVIDELLGGGVPPLQVTWTVPGEEVKLRDRVLGLPGRVRLRIEPEAAQLGLYRAGELVDGSPVISASETGLLGWRSPTYDSLLPASSLVAHLEGAWPLRLLSWWECGTGRAEDLNVTWARPGGTGIPFARVAWGEQEITI